MDAGPILDLEEVPIGPEETAGELEARLAEASAHMLLRDLPAWRDGRIAPVRQCDEDATYTTLIAKGDGAIDWTLSARELALRVRAYNPWPVAYTTWEEKQLRILRASPLAGSADPGRVRLDRETGVVVGTGDGLLVLREVQIAGGKPLSASAFLQGHRDFDGAQLGG
jgi:methionyl-tRNA formyltransferase